MGFIADLRQLWSKYGAYIMLVGLLITFIILFIINHFSHNDVGTNVTWGDIYEHVMSILFKPHSTTPRQRQHRRRQDLTSSRGEQQCKEFVEFYFQRQFIKMRPDFLKNPVTGENLELDLFNEELQLGIEYNGAQHYNYNAFMHKNSRDKFQNQQYRDLIKQDLCKKNEIKLVIVPYTVPNDQIGPFLFKELKKLGFDPHPEAFS